MVEAGDADADVVVEHRQREGETNHAEHRIKQHRQPEQHEQPAAVADQVAQLAVPDQADDGPVHQVSPYTRTALS